jgi:Tfp pilus assembly protein PilW
MKVFDPIFTQRGVTLIEQMAALLLGSVMIIALYSYFRASLYQLVALEAKTATLEDARGALDIMVRDLKNAGSWGAGTMPAEIGTTDDPDSDSDTVCNRIYAATASLLHVQMDLNGNGNCADSDPRENIRYELAGPTSTCAGPNIIRRNGDCLVANVVPLVANKIFTYYDDAGTDLGDSPDRNVVKRVKIAFVVQVKNPDPRLSGSLASSLSSSVEIRN